MNDFFRSQNFFFRARQELDSFAPNVVDDCKLERSSSVLGLFLVHVYAWPASFVLVESLLNAPTASSKKGSAPSSLQRFSFDSPLLSVAVASGGTAKVFFLQESRITCVNLYSLLRSQQQQPTPSIDAHKIAMPLPEFAQPIGRSEFLVVSEQLLCIVAVVVGVVYYTSIVEVKAGAQVRK